MVINIEKLKKEQIELARKLILKDSFEEINTVAGCDLAFFNNKIIAAFVICTYKTLSVVEKKYALQDLKFPYIPGFLNYRESPVIVEAYSKLEHRPSLIILPRSGILHERKLGLASHVGISLDIPTVGITQKLLFGEIKNDKIYVDNELSGIQLKTKEKANPIFISPGHKISLKTSLEVVKKCMKEHHKLPEPLTLAHKYANKIKKANSA